MPKPRARLITTVAASTAAVLLLAACGGDSESDSASGSSSSSSSSGSSSSSSGSTSSSEATLPEPKEKDLKKVEEIKVSDNGGKAPKVSVPGGKVSVSQATLSMTDEGKGKTLPEDAVVKADLALYTAKDGKPVQGFETYTQAPQPFALGSDDYLPGFTKALKGHKAGSEGVAVLPAEDLWGEQGMPQMGIEPGEDMVLVFDVHGALPEKADGKEVTPEKGLPKVDFASNKPAKITIPKGAEKPKKLVSENLREGDGESVEKGDTAYVSYTGVTWRDGKVFDSSMRGGPGAFAFPVGEKAVVPAWDKAVDGAKVGDRLLVVAPPKEAYGEQGRPQGGIKPNSTLVFVVDVLDVEKK